MSDETPTLQDKHRQFSQLVMPLIAVMKINPNSAEAPDEFTAAFSKLSDGKTLGQAIDEARTSLEEAVERTRTERSQVFGRIEADFIRAARETGLSVREVSSGWRVGMLAIEVRRAQSQARALYNHEELVKWKPIRAVEDLEKLRVSAEKLLSSGELPVDARTHVFYDAYVQERERRERSGKSRPEVVPILDFYREVRAALVRFELTNQKPDRKLKYADLPRWQFLYNLDRHRALGLAIPTDRRLGLQTGSQQEASSGKGLTVNGLNADDDYRTMCYVVAQAPLAQ